MSISPALKASARAAYRNLYRAASFTFAGDDRMLNAFRAKMRADASAGRDVTDIKAYKEQIQLSREMADVLRKNIVQAVKVSDAPDATETWRLTFTKDTELGSNDTINNPAPERSDRSMRKKEKAQQRTSSTGVVPPNDTTRLPQRLNFSALRKAHKERVIPELREEDLEESFVRGSGPGGQSINKTENNVQLLHKPTGIRVSCQETRSLVLNRRKARNLLIEKLDKLYNPGLSKGDVLKAKQRERERQRKKKAKKKAEKKFENETISLEDDG